MPAYLVGLWLLVARDVSPRLVLTNAVLIQVHPLLAPVIMSTDVWSYWNSGRLVTTYGLNPYDVVPAARPEDVPDPLSGGDGRNVTTVDGPLFTLGSQFVALVAGLSAATAGLIFKALAAISIVGVVLIVVVKVAPRRAFAAAFVGWNPVVAMQAEGSGHNDAIAAFAIVLAVALLSARREIAGSLAFIAAAFVKWTVLVVAPPLAVDAVVRWKWRRLAAVAFGAAAMVVASTALYGAGWLATFVPFAGTLTETDATTSSMGLWHRLTSLGIPDVVAMALPLIVAGVAYAFVMRDAWRGRLRLALAAGLLLVATPFLQRWYVLIPVSLAAWEEDRTARLLALAFCAWGLNYLGDAGTFLYLLRS